MKGILKGLFSVSFQYFFSEKTEGFELQTLKSTSLLNHRASAFYLSSITDTRFGLDNNRDF